MDDVERKTLRPTVLDDVLDSLEAELASFSNASTDPVARSPVGKAPEGMVPVANDDLPGDPAAQFLIAAYRAC